MAILVRSILRNLKLTIPLVLLLISLFCINANAQQADGKVKKIVIDPGHGGKKPGAVGKIYLEKDIVLGVALRLGALIEEQLPDVEVIYTRKKDINVELHERSNIANKAQADLFISIHANGSPNSELTGSETWVMGLHKTRENLEIAMRENADMMHEKDMEENYDGFDPNSPESYIIFSLIQNTYLEKSITLASFVQQEFSGGVIPINRGVKQAGFVVLYKTAAPSVLIELGFMSNITEEQQLADLDVQQQLAQSIFNAVKRYKANIEGTGYNTIIEEKIDTLTPSIIK